MVLFNYEGIDNMKNIFKKAFGAFTMAEILLSLTIIGVVAAITLPSLTGNINERTWATQKKALFARMSQAFPLLDSVNTFDDAESFIAGGLNTVTKINNVCAAANIEDCGIAPTNIATLNGDILTAFPTGWSGLGVGDDDNTASASGSGSGTTTTNEGDTSTMAAFETGNGESVVLWYNPNCVPDQETAPASGSYEDWYQYVCVNMMYDLNNNKGPNSVGKDIGFLTVFYPMDSIVVSPIPDLSKSTTAMTCNSDEFRVPNKYEAASISLNQQFMSGADAGTARYTTSSKAATSSNTYKVYLQNFNFYGTTGTLTNSLGDTWCVKR